MKDELGPQPIQPPTPSATPQPLRIQLFRAPRTTLHANTSGAAWIERPGWYHVHAMSDVRLTPARARAVADSYQRRLGECIPWSPATPWRHELNFQAASYKVMEVFPGVAASDAPVHLLEPGQFVDSPGGQFRYCVRIQRRGRPMLTWWGSQVGTVIFDDDVIIPALYERRPEDEPGPGPWNQAPWMSLTPAELMTLRPGTRMAKGKVVIAGLGLGHQLIEVSKRLQVKRLVLVEVNQELVDWLLPAIKKHVRKPLEVVVGDAYEVIPRLAADVALIDIFPGYGDGYQKVAELARASPRIKKFWGWGTSEMTGLGQR